MSQCAADFFGLDLSEATIQEQLYSVLSALSPNSTVTSNFKSAQ
jgi:hypothetical protein